jgi:sortase A
MTKSTAGNGSKAWRWTERILLVAGIAGVGVWCGQKAVSAIWEAWANHVFDVEVREEPSHILLPGENPPSKSPSHATPSRQGSIVGRLTIPRLGLSAMIREGVQESTLSLALGHIPNTALPGQPGNVAVAGHRDTIFRSLREIQKKDLIRLETPSSGSYLYQVSSLEVVEPSDVSVLRAGRDSELTLVTCFPFNYIGSAPRRFIVKAREIDRTPPRGGVHGQQISFQRAGPK